MWTRHPPGASAGGSSDDGSLACAQPAGYSRAVGSRYATVDELLDEARGRIERLSPGAAEAATRAGAVLIDIRSDDQRARDGTLTGARFIARNVLEWRLDPASPHRDPACARRDLRLILICDEGYQSSLAAATLRRFGLDATDVVGGFQAWKAAGLATIAAQR
jgi:rhodanese-related sulfurtransferase